MFPFQYEIPFEFSNNFINDFKRFKYSISSLKHYNVPIDKDGPEFKVRGGWSTSKKKKKEKKKQISILVLTNYQLDKYTKLLFLCTLRCNHLPRKTKNAKHHCFLIIIVQSSMQSWDARTRLPGKRTRLRRGGTRRRGRDAANRASVPRRAASCHVAIPESGRRG